ncbi:hypothetical protein XAC908_440003 [Xanthomonas citri pv. citri]|nr:hypothetical protein XAC908_440003 [Xanthomonas citri pv. citri]
MQAVAGAEAGTGGDLAIQAGGRGQREIVTRLQGCAAASGDRHAMQLQVVAGRDEQVLARGHRYDIAATQQAVVVAQGAGREAEVVAGDQRCAAARLHAGAGQGHIVAGHQLQRVTSADAGQDADAVDGLGCFADQVVAGYQRDIAALDLALIEQVVARFQCHAARAADAALVEQVAGGDADVGACNDALVAQGVGGIELDVAAGNQCAVATQLQRVGGQIYDRHQHGLALALLLHHPHDVLRERSRLGCRQAHAHAQLQLACSGHAGFEQGAVLRHAIGVVAQVAAAGELGDLVQHQALLVEAIAQPGLGPLRVHTQLVQQEVAADEVVVVDEARIGLDQVATAGAVADYASRIFRESFSFLKIILATFS